MKKFSDIILGIVLGIVITSLCLYLVYLYNTKKEVENGMADISKNTINEVVVINDVFEGKLKDAIKEVYPKYIDSDVQSMQAQLKIEYPDASETFTDQPSSVIWNNGTYYIQMPSKETFFSVKFRHPQAVKEFKSDFMYTNESKAFDEEIMQSLKYDFFKLITKFDSILLAEGYTKSEENIIRQPWYNTLEVGYTKGDVKCVLGVEGSSLEFNCIKVFEKYETEQTMFIDDLKLGSKAIINVQKVKGNFATIGVHEFGGMGGYFIIAKKADGKWKFVYGGQDVPKCSLMSKYSVPKSIYGGCY